MENQRKILITSALPYVNNIPHLGNIVGSVLSGDVFSKYCHQRGNNVLYICGSDEYGTATEAKALQEGISCSDLCKKYYDIHKSVYEWFGIKFDVFGRTSWPQHKDIVQRVFRGVYKNGFADVRKIEQLFCDHCTFFLADRFVEGICPKCQYDEARGDQCDKCGSLINAVELGSPKCKACNRDASIKETEHIFIRLSLLEDKCKEYFEKVIEGKKAMCKNGDIEGFDCFDSEWSKNGIAITKKWLCEGLKDRCITRDLKWGIDVPECEGLDPEQCKKVFYVWFDAPLGYISLTASVTEDWEDWWKGKETDLYQFMGKDNVPFHSVMFPASLIGSGEEWILPKVISATEYLSFEGQKFSKSRGIGVFGMDVMETEIPLRVWRMYLMMIRPESSDSQFTWEDLISRCNNELVANIGNFVNRVCSFISKRIEGIIRATEEDIGDLEKKLEKNINEELAQYIKEMNKTRLTIGVKKILSISALGNKYLTEAGLTGRILKENPERCMVILKTALAIVGLIGKIIRPFTDDVSDDVFGMLGLSDGKIPDEFILLNKNEEVKVNTPKLLFTRIDEKRLQELKKRFG
eukprot:GHVP01055528.1.p1 GENE.GHVP01055528.1~~GHVP01055528.1.p1  ORF type:complete len:579 (+),score=117.36 GHVP01055528.1:3-1739(+)